MSKRMRYCLRLVLRLCTVFVLIFSILLSDSVVVRAETTLFLRSGPYDSHLIEGVGGLEPEGEAININGFVDSWTSLGFYGNDGVLKCLDTGKRYLFFMSFRGQEMFTAVDSNNEDVSNLFDKNIQVYMLYGGQKYYFTEKNGIFWMTGYVDGCGADAFNICAEFYLYFNNLSSTTNVYVNYLYSLGIYDLNFKIYELSGEAALDSGDLAIHDSIQDGNVLQEEANQLQEEQNETTNNIFQSISDFFGSFFENLIGIFVPEDGYFEDYFNRLNDFFSEKLGMLYAPIDMFIEFLNVFLEADSTDAGITFPEVKWQEYVIIPETKVSLSAYSEEIPELQEYIYFGTDVIMIGSVLILLQNKLNEVMRH